jgi:hypothetical protein
VFSMVMVMIMMMHAYYYDDVSTGHTPGLSSMGWGGYSRWVSCGRYVSRLRGGFCEVRKGGELLCRRGCSRMEGGRVMLCEKQQGEPQSGSAFECR